MILHPTDFSSCAEPAERQAAPLARALGTEILLLWVSVEAPLYGEGLFSRVDATGFYAACRKWAEQRLEARAAALREAGAKVRWLVRTGTPAEEIVAVAQEEGAELIVMGTHGRGTLGRFLLGSVADRVIRLSACPVLTVREGPGD